MKSFVLFVFFIFVKCTSQCSKLDRIIDSQFIIYGYCVVQCVCVRMCITRNQLFSLTCVYAAT